MTLTSNAKFEKNADLVVSKMAWGIGWTFVRAPKSLKIVHWWVLFVQSIYCFSWKISEELCVMTLKGVAKSKCGLVAWKMIQGIWLIFMRAVESPKICTLIGSVCSKHANILMKKYSKVMSHDTEEWCKVWRKTGSWFQKWHEEFGEF